MLDSAEYIDDANPEECACPCGGEEFELAVGFAMVDVGNAGSVTREVKWVSIGARCVQDGTLGVYSDWKMTMVRPTTFSAVHNPAENPNGYCPNHATGVKLPDGFVVTPLEYVD